MKKCTISIENELTKLINESKLMKCLYNKDGVYNVKILPYIVKNKVYDIELIDKTINFKLISVCLEDMIEKQENPFEYKIELYEKFTYIILSLNELYMDLKYELEPMEKSIKRLNFRNVYEKFILNELNDNDELKEVVISYIASLFEFYIDDKDLKNKITNAVLDFVKDNCDDKRKELSNILLDIYDNNEKSIILKYEN